MKTLSLSLLIGFVMFSFTFGQDKTDEKKWTIDPETGDTIYTEAVIISQTEDITPRNSMIVINPLKFLLFYNISYYHKLSDGAAIGGGVQMPTISGIDGFGVNAEVRFYPSGKNLRGFYFAPNVSYNNLSGNDADDESISITSVGGLIGWQWFPGEQFAIGLGIGVDYYFFSGDDNDDDFSSLDGTAPLLRFDIGYAW
ncbi:MAG: hypothetical protein WBN42_12615 [Ignavibacteriaceae bacterium]